MTTQPNETITHDELGSKWGGLLNQAFLAMATLERRVTSQDALIQQMAKNEAALVDRIQDLEEELVRLRPPPSSLSPSLQAVAAEAKAIIDAAGEVGE